MHLPTRVQDILNEELMLLAHDPSYDLDPQQRLIIYRALGPLSIADNAAWLAHFDSHMLPHLTFADRVRTRIAMLAAQKVTLLWQTACQEAEANFTKQDDLIETQRKEHAYLAQRTQRSIEYISVYDVPRTFAPAHILEMADRAFRCEIENYTAFAHEANEWWQICPRPERMERMYYIKWACQEYLYEALGWTKHFQDVRAYETDEEELITYDHTDAPSGYALLAYAAEFRAPMHRFDDDRRREFWHWWLAEAIPRAWQLEQELTGV